jgi:hypothetical protein
MWDSGQKIAIYMVGKMTISHVVLEVNSLMRLYAKAFEMLQLGI